MSSNNEQTSSAGYEMFTFSFVFQSETTTNTGRRGMNDIEGDQRGREFRSDSFAAEEGNPGEGQD
jgi:hypothetical protein